MTQSVIVKRNNNISNLVKHAKAEFEALGWPGGDEMQKAICDDIVQLLKVFSRQGHSGTTAPYALNLFMKLAHFNPISPLTGADSEWVEVSHNVFQNKRDGEVFKESKNGKAYWISGKIFRDPTGSLWTSKDSHVSIEFPWTKPESEIIDVLAE